MTDAKGTFCLELSPAASSEIEVVRRGYGARRRRILGTPESVVFVLFPGTTVGGYVRVNDRGAEDATVSIESAQNLYAPVGLPSETDSEGYFQLPGVPPGPHRMVVRHREFAPQIVPVLIPDRSFAELEITLSPGSSIVGTVVDADGYPLVADVTVTRFNDEELSSVIVEDLSSKSTDQGDFKLVNVPSGTLELAILAPGHTPELVELSLESDEEFDVGEIRLTDALSIGGIVLDSHGSPVPEGTVRAVQTGSTGAVPSFVRWSTEVKDDGTFLFPALAPGRYRVQVTAPAYGTRTLKDVDPGTTDLFIQMHGKGELTGFVVNEDRETVPSFSVEARPVTATGALESMRYSGRDGLFSLPVGEGTYSVTVSAPRLVPEILNDVDVKAEEQRNLATIVLQSGRKLSGLAVDEAGRGVLGAEVALYPSRLGGTLGRPLRRALTSPGGEFEFYGVPDGLVTLVARHPEYAEGRVEGHRVGNGAPAATVQIVLSQGGGLAGAVTDRSSKPTAGTYIQVSSGHVGGANMYTRTERVVTDADGAFRMDKLPAGPARIELLLRAGGALVAADERQVEINPNETAFVQFVTSHVVVRGVATRNGSLATHRRVTFAPDRLAAFILRSSTVDRSSGLMAGRTDDSGFYELLVMKPGSYLATLESYDGGYHGMSKRVEVPDRDEVFLDLDFTTTEIRGIVLDAESDEPFAGARVRAAPRDGATNPHWGGITDVDGTFVLYLDGGAYDVQASKGEFLSDPVLVDARAPRHEPITLRLRRSIAISGVVVDGAGRGVPGVWVAALAIDGSDQRPHLSHTRIDGSFELDGVRSGRFSLFARTSAHEFAHTVASPQRERHTLPLSRGKVIDVYVTDDRSQPVAKVEVVVVAVDAIPVFDMGGGIVTSDEGFAQLSLPDGSVTLRFRAGEIEKQVEVPAFPERKSWLEVQLNR